VGTRGEHDDGRCAARPWEARRNESRNQPRPLPGPRSEAERERQAARRDPASRAKPRIFIPCENPVRCSGNRIPRPIRTKPLAPSFYEETMFLSRLRVDAKSAVENNPLVRQSTPLVVCLPHVCVSVDPDWHDTGRARDSEWRASGPSTCRFWMRLSLWHLKRASRCRLGKVLVLRDGF